MLSDLKHIQSNINTKILNSLDITVNTLHWYINQNVTLHAVTEKNIVTITCNLYKKNSVNLGKYNCTGCALQVAYIVLNIV